MTGIILAKLRSGTEVEHVVLTIFLYDETFLPFAENIMGNCYFIVSDSVSTAGREVSSALRNRELLVDMNDVVVSVLCVGTVIAIFLFAYAVRWFYTRCEYLMVLEHRMVQKQNTLRF